MANSIFIRLTLDENSQTSSRTIRTSQMVGLLLKDRRLSAEYFAVSVEIYLAWLRSTYQRRSITLSNSSHGFWFEDAPGQVDS